MSEITAVFEVYAGTVGEATLDVTGMSIDEMAAAVDAAVDPYVSVCHQCADHIDDPQVGEMVAFTVDGVHYEQQGGKWVRADGE